MQGGGGRTPTTKESLGQTVNNMKMHGQPSYPVFKQALLHLGCQCHGLIHLPHTGLDDSLRKLRSWQTPMNKQTHHINKR
jgi:hypothetical protein